MSQFDVPFLCSFLFVILLFDVPCTKIQTRRRLGSCMADGVSGSGVSGCRGFVRRFICASMFTYCFLSVHSMSMRHSTSTFIAYMCFAGSFLYFQVSAPPPRPTCKESVKVSELKQSFFFNVPFFICTFVVYLLGVPFLYVPFDVPFMYILCTFLCPNFRLIILDVRLCSFC